MLGKWILHINASEQPHAVPWSVERPGVSWFDSLDRYVPWDLTVGSLSFLKP